MTMSSTKMADSTGNADTAAPQMAYGITEDQEIQEEAVDAARSGDTAGTENEIQSVAAMAEEEAAMPEGEAAEDSANMAEMTDSASTDSGQQAASGCRNAGHIAHRELMYPSRISDLFASKQQILIHSGHRTEQFFFF